MLSDLHTIDLNQRHPTWKQIQPRLLPSSMYSISSNSKTATAAGSSNPSRPALLSLAGHCGGVDQSGHIVFWGGYQRNDLKEPQSVIQVLTQGVKPPTADAAQLTRGESNSLALALQHVRQQLARLVRQHHPQQVQVDPTDSRLSQPPPVFTEQAVAAEHANNQPKCLSLLQQLIDTQTSGRARAFWWSSVSQSDSWLRIPPYLQPANHQ